MGFVQAGGRLLWANEADKDAAASYRENVGKHLVEGDLSEIELPGDLQPDLVIGGPPCQGFSVAGRMDPSDPRNQLVHRFLDAVKLMKPQGFVMENVKALGVSPRWEALRCSMLNRARALGYCVEIFVVNAADFGVPQARERMFFIGLRGKRPLAPRKLGEEHRCTVRQALKALPAFGKPGNDLGSKVRVVPASRPVMRPSAYKGSLLFNGSGRPLQLDQPAKTLPASMGGNSTPIIDQEELRHRESWVVAYHERLCSGHPVEAVVPEHLRRLTVQEAAALQSFPIEASFEGSLVSKYRQIGNAVPPVLAYHVFLAVQRALAVPHQHAQRAG
jgi:DNA (cytosine-5)-methyltransferase 1